MSNTYCVVFLFCVPLSCTLCCQFLWIVHSWLPLRYSPTFMYTVTVKTSTNINKANNHVSPWLTEHARTHTRTHTHTHMTPTCDVGNPDYGFGHAQKCGGWNRVIGSQPCPLDNWSPTAIRIETSHQNMHIRFQSKNLFQNIICLIWGVMMFNVTLNNISVIS